MNKIRIITTALLLTLGACSTSPKKTKLISNKDQIRKAKKSPTELDIPTHKYQTYKLKKVEIEKIKPIEERGNDYTRVGLLLPLSGKAKNIGESLKNAAQMAFFSSVNNDFVLQFYDTEGSVNGAKQAARKALSENADIIIGPLFSKNVKAVDDVLPNNISAISFTTDPSVVGGNIYSIGLFLQTQVERILNYAVENGVYKTALLVPDSNAGKNVVEAAKQAGSILGIEITDTVYYGSSNNSKKNAVKQIADYNKRHQKVAAAKREFANAVTEDGEINLSANITKNNLYAAFPYLKRNGYFKNIGSASPVKVYQVLKYVSREDFKHAAKIMENKDTIGDVDYDGILIIAEGNDLILLGSLLKYHDVSPRKVKFLGTNLWNSKKALRENNLRGSWFSAFSERNKRLFEDSYRNTFDTTPHDLAFLAYDAVSMIGVLLKNGDVNRYNLTDPSGYVGVNGAFRILPNGFAERALEVREILGNGRAKIKSRAPNTFRKSFYNRFAN